MAAMMAALPAQVRDAWTLGQSVALPDALRGARAIVFLGVGGSAIGGDLLGGAVADRLAIPLIVHRGEEMPRFVDSRTLVIACSYSGETAETLAALAAARPRGAPTLVVTAGGRLGERAAHGDVGTIRLPAGLLPRTALAFCVLPVLAALVRLGYLPPCGGEVDEAVAVLEAGAARMDSRVAEERNPARQLARQLHGHLALVWGGGPWGAAVARRWKGQLNENAKHVAAFNVFPELVHNEIESWGHPDGLAGRVRLVLLRDGHESERQRRRTELTAALGRERLAGVSEVWSEGSGTLARLLSLVQVGDWTSFYLAALNGVDPTPIPEITRLKRELT
jgi:glucose/mannose-6-phosphate isomerase